MNKIEIETKTVHRVHITEEMVEDGIVPKWVVSPDFRYFVRKLTDHDHPSNVFNLAPIVGNDGGWAIDFTCKTAAERFNDYLNKKCHDKVRETATIMLPSLRKQLEASTKAIEIISHETHLFEAKAKSPGNLQDGSFYARREELRLKRKEEDERLKNISDQIKKILADHPDLVEKVNE